MYKPDRWVILKINSPNDPHLRVFASWRGGYLDSESWRLNSGITKVEEHKEYFIFHGNTGSQYKCYKEAYGIASLHAQGVLESFIKKQPTIEPVDYFAEIDLGEWI